MDDQHLDDIQPCVQGMPRIEEIAANERNALVGGPFGSNLVSRDYVDFGVPVVRGQNLGTGRWVTGEFAYVSNEKALELSANFARPGDIVFTQRGTLGQVAIVPDRPFDKYVISQSQMKLTVDRSKADPLFVYYVFTTNQMQEYIINHAITTGVPHTNLGILRQTPIPLLPLEQQRAIAHVLGTLDDKIDLNRQMNQTLEQIAAALFKSWFVDFDPVRAKAEGRQPEGMDAETAALFPDRLVESEIGEIPEGWQVIPVGDVVGVVGGSTPSTKESEYWDGDIPFATPKDLSKIAAPVLLGTERYITNSGLTRISSGLIPRHSLLLSSRAPIGYLAINEVPVSVNQGMIVMICNQGVSPWFMLGWAQRNQDEFIGRANGTTFLEISKKNFRPIPVILPTDPVRAAFDAIMKPLFARLIANLRQTQTLTQLRDTLLPRLLSGELRVPTDVLDEEAVQMQSPSVDLLVQSRF